MLPNKFDQYFRDKLLDHSTKVSPSTWKMIHAGLLRHKAFHLWNWYVAGPSVVVVALTGYLILAQINKPVKTHAGPSSHIPTQPITTPTQTAAASETTPPATMPPTTTPTTTPARSPSAPAGSPAPANIIVPANPTAPTIAPATTNTRSLANANTRHVTNTRRTSDIRHTANTPPAPGAHTRREPTPRSETALLASDASPTEPANLTQNRSTLSHRPSGMTNKPTIVRTAIRLAVTAKNPNPKATKSLTLPSVPYHPTGRWRLDGFGSPEYFSFKGFGFSYGAGARATIVLKKHFTITSGMQYLKVDVTARSQKDSLNQLYPGYFNNIQIPVFFGYTIGNDRFSFTANAGMIFSLYADAHNRLKTEGWPNRNGPSAYFGLNFATHVNNRISLFAEPYIKCWYPQRFQNLPPRLYSTGISIGLRYDLK
jgi:hypothetical protein